MYDYGCLYCRTGGEGALAAKLEENYPRVEAIVARKARIKRVERECIEEETILFPGYLFFRVRRDEAARNRDDVRPEELLPVGFNQIFRWVNIYRLLTNLDGDWRLTGPDRQMAEKLFDMNGTIGFSRVYFDEGNRVRVLEGFLKDYEGDIIRIDKRHRSAQIRIEFQGRIITEWLGYEVIELPDAAGGDNKAPDSGAAAREAPHS